MTTSARVRPIWSLSSTSVLDSNTEGEGAVASDVPTIAGNNKGQGRTGGIAPSPTQRDWWHRRWWIVLLCLLLFVALGLSLFYLAILRPYAWNTVLAPDPDMLASVIHSTLKKNDIQVISLQLSNPTDSTVDISLVQDLGQMPAKPLIRAFEGTVSDDAQNPLFKVSVPEFTGHRLQIPRQRVSIIDTVTTAKFASGVLLQENARLRFTGKTKVRIFGREVPISINKLVTFTGLSNATVSFEKLTGNTQLFHISARASYNQSPISVDLGACNFTMQYEGTPIADLWGEVALHPGITELVLDGKANLLHLMSDAKKVLNFINEIRTKASVELELVGQGRPGSQWTDTAIKDFSRPVTLTATQLRDAILSVGYLGGHVDTFGLLSFRLLLIETVSSAKHGLQHVVTQYPPPYLYLTSTIELQDHIAAICYACFFFVPAMKMPISLKSTKHNPGRTLIYLGFGSVLPGVLVMLVLYLKLPALVQLAVTRSVLTLDRLSITQPTEDSFELHLHGSLSKLPFRPRLAETSATLQSSRGIEYASLFIPAFSGSVLDSVQTARITNASEFEFFCGQLLREEVIETKVRGTTRILLGKRSFPAVLQKSVLSKGMHGPKIDVEKVKIDKTGALPLEAVSNLFNPSPFEMILGNVSLAILYHGVKISEMNTNLDIKRGNNTIEQRGSLTLQNLPESILQAFSEESAAGTLQGRLLGQSAASNISWVNALVGQIDRNITLPVKDL